MSFRASTFYDSVRSLLQSNRLVLTNITWLGATGLLVKPLWFLFLTFVCIRFLGADGYGVFMTALSLTTLAFSFNDFGLTQYLVREVARDRGKASLLFSNILFLRAGLAIVTSGIVLSVTYILGYSRPLFVSAAWACLFSATLGATSFARGFFKAFEVLKYEGISTVAEKVLVISGGIALLITTQKPQWTLLGMSIGMVLTTIGILLWIHRHLVPFRRDLLDLTFLARTIRKNIAFTFLGVLGMVYFRIDTIMVEAFLGTTAAGQYGLAFRIVEALNMLPLIVAYSAIYPRLSILFSEHNHVAGRRLVRLGLGGLAVASLAITGSIVLLAPQIINLLANNPSMDPAASALRYLCLTFPFTCLRNTLYVALLALHKQRTVVIFLVLTTILNISLNFWAIPRLGIIGACVTTIVSECVLLSCYAAFYRYSDYSQDSQGVDETLH